MKFSVKLRRKGHKKLNTYSIVVIEKKKSIYSVYYKKIGDYVYLKQQQNKASVFISQNKLNFCRLKGISLEGKILNWIKNV